MHTLIRVGMLSRRKAAGKIEVLLQKGKNKNTRISTVEGLGLVVDESGTMRNRSKHSDSKLPARLKLAKQAMTLASANIIPETIDYNFYS